MCVVFDFHCVIIKALCVYMCVSSVVCDLHCVVVEAVCVCVCTATHNESASELEPPSASRLS